MDATPDDRPSDDQPAGAADDAPLEPAADFAYAQPAEDADLPEPGPPVEEVMVAEAVAGPVSQAAGPSGPSPILKRFEKDVHDVTVELHRVEGDVRALLGDRDPRRKRKLSGVSRWQELEEDILAWRFADRYDESTLRRLQELVARWHYLSKRLRFLAATRPVLNS